ncbi:MAG: hypothetical protein A2Y33_02985 [Spirochaetes bacterium GWF1_51_8]|nr:MAG: hypothetical protein A2Y33_02985 [Spirochaetes bacterium GWF1_51_8]
MSGTHVAKNVISGVFISSSVEREDKTAKISASVGFVISEKQREIRLIFYFIDRLHAKYKNGTYVVDFDGRKSAVETIIPEIRNIIDPETDFCVFHFH